MIYIITLKFILTLLCVSSGQPQTPFIISLLHMSQISRIYKKSAPMFSKIYISFSSKVYNIRLFINNRLYIEYTSIWVININVENLGSIPSQNLQEGILRNPDLGRIWCKIHFQARQCVIQQRICHLRAMFRVPGENEMNGV